MSPSVRRFLEARGALFRVIEHAPLVSFEDARQILDLDPGTMVKALGFAGPDGSLTLVALRGGDRADYKKIADAIGVRRADLKLADAAAVEAELDMQAGGFAPLPVNGVRVLADRAVLALDEIVCGTGRNTATLIIGRDAWVALAEPEIGDFAKAG